MSHSSDCTTNLFQHSMHPPGSSSSKQAVASAEHEEEDMVDTVVVPSSSSPRGLPDGEAVGLEVGDEDDVVLLSSPIACFVRRFLI